MFFSVAEYNDYLNSQNRPFPGGLKELKKFMREIRQRVINRDFESGRTSSHPLTNRHALYKWTRPWSVVPALRNYQPPAGEFGVGIEVEMGFRSREAASRIVQQIANWKHIAIDAEGGTYGIETTFPPIDYKKLTKRSQVYRYLQLLERNSHEVRNHGDNSGVGTHVNVSYSNPTTGALSYPGSGRVGAVSDVLRYYVNDVDKRRYFGRHPYGYGYNQGRFIEWKLFNSRPHPRDLFQYVDIAVELTRLVHSRDEITETSVRAALEAGYNKRRR